MRPKTKKANKKLKKNITKLIIFSVNFAKPFQYKNLGRYIFVKLKLLHFNVLEEEEAIIFHVGFIGLLIY